MDEASEDSSLRIAALPIGQGDAILIHWRDGPRRWTCLVDGGESATNLESALRAEGVEHLDLLVVTHLDSDHIAGLGDWITRDPTSFPTVGCYWGPALAAFERHAWLFGARCAKALERGRRLEDGLRSRDPDLHVLYPLEGFTTAPWGREGPQIEVLNPPARLIERLLIADDITELLTAETTPMGWLLEPAAQPDDDEELRFDSSADFRGGLVTRALDPVSLAHVRPGAASLDAAALAKDVYSLHGVEPHFFGNQLFNNSSLVLWLDLPVGGRSYSALLTGDLENWTYLVGRHRKGLQPDLLKAPHHGGRVYIEGVSGAAQESADALHRYLRPKTVLVSSIGAHKLPHETTRDAWIRWGASVLCTCTRGREILVGPQPREGCCAKNRGCEARPEAIAIRVDRHGVEASHQACHSGFGDANAPPVVVHQQIINPSPALEILGDLEMRRYLNWVGKKLRSIHDARIKNGTAQSSTVVSDADLRAMAAAESRRIGPLAAHLTTVLDVGMKRERLWSAERGRGDPARTAYTRPKPDEIGALVRALREIGMIAWLDATATRIGDRESFILGLGHDGLSNWAHGRFGFPSDTFRDLLLPAMLAELRKPSWSILAHPAGGVLMVHGADVRSRFEIVVEALRERSKSHDFPLCVALSKAQSSEHRDQLEGLFGAQRFHDEREWWGSQDKRTALDTELRALLEAWSGSELERGAAWQLGSIDSASEPTIDVGTQMILLGHTTTRVHERQRKLQDWLRPTPAALGAADFGNNASYGQVLDSVVRQGWTGKKCGWYRGDVEILLESDDVRVSTLDAGKLDETVAVYAKLVLESFKRLSATL